MKLINYVLATWSGKRDSVPKTPYLTTHLEQLKSINHNLSQITIGYPYNPSELPDYTKYIKKLNKINDTPIVVESMENNGRSYGQYNRIFAKYKNQFKYWIFMEDDYVPVLNNFDRELINLFEENKNKHKRGGFLCQWATKWLGNPYHAAISNGITDNDSLNKVWNKFGGCLPHDKIGYKNGQVTFSRAFLDAKLFLKDIKDKYRTPYFHLTAGIQEFAPKNSKYIFVPIQMLNIQNQIIENKYKFNRKIKLI